MYVFGAWDDSEKAYFYGVVVFEANGVWQSITPSCDPVGADEKWYGLDLAAAKQAGADVKTSDSEDVCMFSSASTLFDAMRNVVAAPGFWDRVEAAKT